MGTRGDKRLVSLLRPSQVVWKLSDAARQLHDRRTLIPTAALGRRGENVAHRYLKARGFLVIARNYRLENGSAEIDIVARDRDTTVFVEVKSRTSAEYGSPDRAISAEKQRNIYSAARSYALRAGIRWSAVRFDVVSIVFSPHPAVVHHQDVFFYGRARE
jgi:putative endonuclease